MHPFWTPWSRLRKGMVSWCSAFRSQDGHAVFLRNSGPSSRPVNVFVDIASPASSPHLLVAGRRLLRSSERCTIDARRATAGCTLSQTRGVKHQARCAHNPMQVQSLASAVQVARRSIKGHHQLAQWATPRGRPSLHETKSKPPAHRRHAPISD